MDASRNLAAWSGVMRCSCLFSHRMTFISSGSHDLCRPENLLHDADAVIDVLYFECELFPGRGFSSAIAVSNDRLAPEKTWSGLP
jgi:hypothetical protein